MRSFNPIYSKATALLLSLVLSSGGAGARSYMAVASGDYTNSRTWGEQAPLKLEKGDELIIVGGVIVNMDADVDINGTLILEAGVLALNGHTLNFGAAGDLVTGNGGAIKSVPGSDINISSTEGFTSNLSFTPGSVLGALTVNTQQQGIYLGSDIIISGLLTLESGTLYLNNQELFLAGKADIAARGTGVLYGTPLSDVGVFTEDGLSSPLRFSPKGNMVRNFTVSFGEPDNALGVNTDLLVSGSLVLASGRLDMADKKIAMGRNGEVIGDPNAGRPGKSRKERRSKDVASL